MLSFDLSGSTLQARVYDSNDTFATPSGDITVASTLTASDLAQLRFSGAGGGNGTPVLRGTSGQFDFDEFRFATAESDILAIPEPASLALLGLGGLMLLPRRKRA